MLIKKELLEHIGLKLAHLKACVATLNEIRFFDLNVASEDFFASLLNAVYGYSLVNLNHATLNKAAVDLGDGGQRLAVQVTSERTKAKIQTTLDKFAEQGLGADYDALKVLIIGDRTGDYPTLTVPPGVEFYAKDDVIDIPQLMRDISRLEVVHLQRIANLIRQEIRDVSTESQKAEARLIVTFDANRDITPQINSVGYPQNDIIKVVRICVQNPRSSTVKNCRAHVTQIDHEESSTTVLHDARCLNWENQNDGFEPIDLIPGIGFRADLVVAEVATPQVLGTATNTNAHISVLSNASCPSVLRVVSRPPFFIRNAGRWIFTVRIGADSAATETLRLKVIWDGTVNGLSAEVVK